MKIRLILILLIAPVSLFAQRTWDTIPFVPDHYKEMVARFKKEPIVKDKVLFLGNSITEAGNWRKLLKDSSVINRGISGDITFGILNRLDDVTKRQPSKLFLLIGINDFAKGIPDEVVMENIFSIVARIKRSSPKTKIFVQSILPTNPNVPSPALFPNHVTKGEHVLTINGQLEKYADRLKYTFVELHSKFTNSEGLLDPKYSTDGLHLNDAGYLHWVQILKGLKYL